MLIHHRSHRIAVTLVAALALVAVEASGEGFATDASAMFQGRPLLAGAQGGLGAQAGPPQGGVGLQGTQGAERGLRPPRVIRELREEKERAAMENDVVAQNNTDMLLLVPPRTVRPRS